MTEQPLSGMPQDDKQTTIDAQEDGEQIGNSLEPFSPNITWLIEQMLSVKSSCRPDNVHGDIAEYVLDLNRQGFDMPTILSKLKMLADLARQHHEMRYADYAQFILRQVRKAKQKRMPMPLRWEDQPGMPKRWFLKETDHTDRDEEIERLWTEFEQTRSLDQDILLPDQRILVVGKWEPIPTYAHSSFPVLSSAPNASTKCANSAKE